MLFLPPGHADPAKFRFDRPSWRQRAAIKGVNSFN